MTIFDHLDRMPSRQIDRVYAVNAVVGPKLRSPNGRAVADPERGEIICRGIFD